MPLPSSEAKSLMWLHFSFWKREKCRKKMLLTAAAATQHNTTDAPIYMFQLQGPISPFTFQGKWDCFCKKDIFVELMLHMFELFPKRCIPHCFKHSESSLRGGGAWALSWQGGVFVFGFQFSSWLPHHTAVGMRLWISMKWHGLFCLVDLVFPKLVLISPEPVVNIRLW